VGFFMPIRFLPHAGRVARKAGRLNLFAALFAAMTDRRRHSAEKQSHAVGMGTTAVPRREAPRLYLVTPPLGAPDEIANDLADALNATDIAAVLVRLEDGDAASLLTRIKVLRILIQSNGAALLLDGHPALVGPAEADGAHLAGPDALRAATASLKPKYIAGCGALASRHDAMMAGESGTDYVMFGEPNGSRPAVDAVIERIAWWAEIFQIPCVAYAAQVDEVEALVRAGADFVAIGEAIWRDRQQLGAAVERLAAAEPVR
jgi:thiamine-phosphate pyrophosphorylase